ncbi:MAG: LPS export ABC transporter permease LptG [Gammaproteobacteria bacterium]
MKILRRYITVHLAWVTLLALFALVALFSFFELIDELGDVGKGTYGIPQVLLYIFLSMPRLAYELFPIAAVIGAMTVLGVMARNSELDVIRTSGVSRLKLAGLMARAGLLPLIIAVVIGEFIAPSAEETAQQMRSVATTEQITLKTKYGLWVRDGNSFINIRTVLPDNRVNEVYIYEFDDSNRLRSSLFAESAAYRDNRWVLQHVRQTRISEERVRSEQFNIVTRDALLAPEVINFIAIKPRYLTLWELIHYIRYLKDNAQNTIIYEQALWAKVIRPFSIIAMIILAVPLVRGNSRSTAIGQRVFIGAGAGIVFYLCNEISGHLGVVYGFAPSVSAIAPTAILIMIILFMLRE